MKRSVVIDGRKTSVSLEEPFWQALKEIAAARGMVMSEIVRQVGLRRTGNLSSALRLFVLKFYLDRIEPMAEHRHAKSFSDERQ